MKEVKKMLKAKGEEYQTSVSALAGFVIQQVWISLFLNQIVLFVFTWRLSFISIGGVCKG